MKVETWPIDKPIEYARNARNIPEKAVDAIAASVKEFGFRSAIVVDEDGVILAGHTRLRAAKKLGLKQVPVHVAAGLSKAQRRAFRIADNKTATFSSFDEQLLALEIEDLKLEDFDLSLTGFDSDELKALLALNDGTKEGLTDEDAAPETQPAPLSKLGDLWLCGKHRVLCGDSTLDESTSKLLGAHVPDLVFSDPPYGVSVVKSVAGGGGKPAFGKVGGGWVDSSTYAVIEGDSDTKAARGFYEVCKQRKVSAFLLWGGNYFTDFLPSSPCWVIWDKQNTGNFADVEMAWTSYSKGARLYSYLWNGLSRAGDRKTELVSRVHPTQKPVGLFERIFTDFPFASCYDGFLGSGSTLIACEKTGRQCYGMELAAAYVDVIVKRWQDFTGKEAVHEDGSKFNDRLA